MEEAIIYLYDDRVEFYPITETLKKALVVWTNVRINDEESERRKELLYYEENYNGKVFGVTHQGFWQVVMSSYVKDGIFFREENRRISRTAMGYPEPSFDKMYGFRFSQEQLLKDALKKDRSGLIGAPTRYGKCLCEGTKVLIYKGHAKPVERVRVGDKLIGPDGRPRKVIALGSGIEPTYHIVPEYGEDFYCNESHILSLKIKQNIGEYKKGNIVNLTVKDYLSRSEEFKKAAFLWYAAVEYKKYSEEEFHWTSGYDDGKYDDNYSISETCLLTTKRGRRYYLAGLLDRVKFSGDPTCAVKKTLNEEYANDLIRLCRSIGFRAVKKKDSWGDNPVFGSWVHWRVEIQGQFQMLPMRFNRNLYKHIKGEDYTVSAFTVEQVDPKPYYGFEVEGPDKLFLLWDHLVTHNTSLMVNTVRAYPTLTTCIIAPGVDLVNQLYSDLTEKFGIKDRTVHIVHGTKKLKKTVNRGDVVVCSIDSVDHITPEDFDLLLVDEPHAFATPLRVERIERFNKARRIGFGATLEGRSDGRDKLIVGLFGPILAQRTYKEAVAEGAICPLEIIFFDIELSPSTWKKRVTAYKHMFFQNRTIGNLIKRICDEVIPEEMQTLIFIKNEDQANFLQDIIGHDTCVAMAKTMSNERREEVTSLLRNNIIKRCLCSRIYVQGVTFSDVRFLINAEAGGNNTSAIQKPGRLAEIRPGKKCGIIIDFFFKPVPGVDLNSHYKSGWSALCKESNSRNTAYKKKGYGITHVSSIEELKQLINSKL